MAWDDFLPHSWDEFISGTPNAAGDARAAIAPAADALRGPNGSFDSAKITSRLPESVQSPEMNDYIGLDTALGNMKQGYIDRMQPTGGGINLGNLLRVAGVGVSYGQGNRDAGASLLEGLQSDAAKRQAFMEDKQKLGLENADNVFSGIGKFGTDYLSKKMDTKLKVRQQLAQAVALARLQAGDDPVAQAAAQAKAVRALTPMAKAYGFNDVAREWEQGYPEPPVSTEPSSSSPSANVPLPAPAAGGQPGPTIAAAAVSRTGAIPTPPPSSTPSADANPPGMISPDVARAAVQYGIMTPEEAKFYTDSEAGKVAERTKLATKMNLNPEQRQQYIANGKVERPTPNNAAISKAEDLQSEIENGIDYANQALAHNQGATYTGPWSPLTGIASWFGSKGAQETQVLDFETAQLSQILAKAASLGRTNVAEQQLQKRLLDSATRPAPVRAEIIKQVRDHLQNKLDVVKRRAEGLRNGTYSETDAGQNQTQLPDPLGLRR